MRTDICASHAPLVADKARLKQMIVEQWAQMGLEYDPTATAEEAQRLIRRDGVLPEDNLFSCGIIAARDEE